MSKKQVIIVGSEGFIGSYITSEFLKHGYEVIGIDNCQKYGDVERSFHDNENYIRFLMDFEKFCKNRLYTEFNPDYLVNCAGVIGGIGYFHKKCYDLLSINERILADFGDLSKEMFLNDEYDNYKRSIWFSSSMIYSESNKIPHEEEDIYKNPPPRSAYGFQKLAVHYFAESLFLQYRVPFNIVIPFNAIGIGELKPKDLNETFKSGEIKIAFSHVVPDLIVKILRGQYPLRLLGDGEQIRCFTDCRDIARATRMLCENENIVNETFNIGSNKPLKIKELAEIIWKLMIPNKEFKWESEPGFEHDVRKRIPDTSKAKNLLNFEPEIPLETSLKEIISWISKMEKGGLV